MKNILSKARFVLATASLVLTAQWSFGQFSTVQMRFANPAYDCNSNSYCLDVEMNSDSPGDTLYGMNVRFYYNSTVMTFTGFQNVESDYIISIAPTAAVGQPSSGADFLNFDAGEAASWVNGAIELQTLSGGKSIDQGAWTKFFEVCFTLSGPPTELLFFCPEIIWDKQNNVSSGFITGSDGVIITAKAGLSTIAVDEQVVHYNWDYSGFGTAPYGNYSVSIGGCLTQDCSPCTAPIQGPTLKSN